MKKTTRLTDNPRHFPYKIIDDYIKDRDKYNSRDEPFFIFSGGLPVKPVHVRAVLRKMLDLIGLRSA